MKLDKTICYRALKSHDHRFDGVFFTCVTSTGIYCRPICPAIVPKRENCQFVGSSIEAEKAGFRPCLRCRPELAPSAYAEGTVAYRLASYIDETLLMDETIGDAARKFKISERQLRRIFIQTFGVEPKRYLISRRLLFAKQLLQDTTLPMTDIAFSAGFNSRGRLTINMKRFYGFTPERLRKDSVSTARSQTLILRADYRPPFHWEALLDFIKGRLTPMERVAQNTYYRHVGSHEISVTQAPGKNYLLITIPVELSRKAHAILKKVRRLYDLDANPSVVDAALAEDPFLEPLLKQHPGLRVPGCWDNFEMLLRAIIGQQVSVAGATTVMRRLSEGIGTTPEAILKSSPQSIAAMGMPVKRATTIWTIARQVHEGSIDLEEKDPEHFYTQLLAVPGIGPWTAEYLQLRILGWPNAFPAGDLGLQKALQLNEKASRQRANAWQPWRSYATMLLWRSLQNQGD